MESATTSATTRVIEEYKNLDAFEEDATEARVEAYSISFNDCKAKFAWAYLGLDLSNIVTDGTAPEEGREERGTEATEVLKYEVTMVENPASTIVENPAITVGVDT